MFVIVLDPDDGELYWGDLSRMADTAYGEVKTVSVLPNNRLTPDGLDEFLETARLACSARRSDPLLNLTSTNPSLVQSALFDCLAVGRHDARYFKLVRWAIPSMGDQRSVCSAIHLLAHATSHPDIFWHRENTVQERVAAEVRTSFRWTPNELAMLLARVPEEELWERGTFGESLYMIMVADPSLEWSIDRLMTQAFLADELIWLSCWVKGPPFGPKWVRTDRESIIIPLLTLALYVAKDPRDRLDELAEHLPPIRNVHLFSEIAAIIEGFGQIDIF
jgi:hypothetical protein